MSLRLAPISSPECRAQIGALPLRQDGDGVLRVLLITSRETGRWIIPKGWPMKGRKAYQAAEQEALEEAGVTGRISKTPIGSFTYWKRQADHFELCEVTVYPMTVEHQRKRWDERAQRTAAWFTLDEAARQVGEPGLIAILHAIAASEAIVSDA